MKYIRNFSEHSAYEAEISKIPTPSVSYCRKENECHFVPFNVIMFKVGDLNGNTNQKVKVSYNEGGSDTIPIVEGNRWYVHNIPSGKSLKLFIGIRDIITDTIISAKLKRGFTQTAFIEEASGDVKFIGCDTSNVTDMEWMFNSCLSLQTLDLSSFDTSKVTEMGEMFRRCFNLRTIYMRNCNQATIDKIKAQLKTDGILDKVTIITE